MLSINSGVEFLINLTQFQTELSRRFDSKLNGISLNEFIILFHLEKAENGKMRRIDLAEKVGLTASGITRLLLPMEKIGLVKKESSAKDARISFVVLASGGAKKLNEALERAELFATELIPAEKTAQIEEFSKLLVEIRKNI